ncbi:hypothetical protein QBC37DRAFT_379839 [Rhypophila decipiens]|uniref:Uncharacterized protein n=1 Tax=Rhypophila decipiens TaxID=261697 RepID=A0AAN7B1R0_9PEZI|nr:hypothetical protein QBC37DRAFT_379839 [Rhypophila decipiens]
MARNLFRDTTLEIQLQPKKWREVLNFPKSGDGSPQADIFLVHDLSYKGGDMQDRLERYITGVCSSAASASRVSVRLRSYRIDPEALQKGCFDEEYVGFVSSIQGILAKSAFVSPSALPSGVIFMAFELGLWVVQKFLYDHWPESDLDNSSNLKARLTGFFFFGPAKVVENGSEYTRERLDKFKTHGSTDKAVPMRRFSRIQGSFHDLLKSDDGSVIAQSTWVVPPPNLESSIPHLPVSEDTVDGLKRTKSRLLNRVNRLAQRGRHRPSAPDPDPDHPLPVAESISVFCRRVHATVVGRDPSADFNTDSDHYVNYINLSVTDRKESISSSMDVASGVSARHPTEEVGSFDDKPFQHRPATVETSLILRRGHGTSSRAPLFVQTPLPYGNTHENTSYFDERVHGNMPDILAPHSPGGSSHSPSGNLRFFRSDSGQSGSLSPRARSKRRQKSVSWKDTLTPENPIAMNVTKQIGEYYRLTTRGSEEPHLYQKWRTSLFKYHISPLECRIRAREALLQFTKGKYTQAKEALGKLMDEIQKVDKGASSEKGTQDASHDTGHEDKQKEAFKDVLPEVRYHWCVVAVRLGEYEAAYDELACLEQTDWFQAINDILAVPSTEIEASNLNNPRVEVVININRVLGLLWGIFGHFDRGGQMIRKADEQCCKLQAIEREATIPDPEPGQFPIDLKTTEMKMVLTRVKVMMLQGHDNDAQTLLLSLLPRLQSLFSGAHFLTLEAISLHGAILATLSDKEAESTCVSAYEATRQHLGEYHPLCMEVLGTLAEIYLAKSRPYEALDTVNHLRKKARERIASEHPQVFRYWLQIGDMNLSIGNFTTAHRELEELCAAAAKTRNRPLEHHIEQHCEPLRSLCPAARRIRDKAMRHELGEDPETLRYKMKLAMATACLGKMEEANRGAEECLRAQLVALGSGVSSVRVAGAGLYHLVETLLDERDMDPFAPPSPLHPAILESLVTCSSILEKQDPGCKLADRILVQVLKDRERLYSDSHWLNLSLRLEIAFNRLENGVNSADEAVELVSLFEDVTSSCEDSLGAAHIFTLRAKLGQLFTDG